MYRRRLVPDAFVGAVMDVCQIAGIFTHMEYITPERARIEYELPLAEILMILRSSESQPKDMPRL